MVVRKDKMNLRPPPDTGDFATLFHFIWDHGLGNRLSRNGDPVPWTDETLEATFENLGRTIDKRSIQNWHSGKNRPGKRNLHVLARLVSGGDDSLRQNWADALLATIRKSSHQSTSGAPAKDINIESSSGDYIKFKVTNLVPKKHLGPIASLVVFALTISVFVLASSKSISVTNLTFCDEARFSQQEKICMDSVKIFPGDIMKIYVSFKIENAPEGQPFERRWYRNGEQFLERDGFLDAAWTGYTYILNPYTHDPGNYAMRVIVNGKVTTGTFVVEELGGLDN